MTLWHLYNSSMRQGTTTSKRTWLQGKIESTKLNEKIIYGPVDTWFGYMYASSSQWIVWRAVIQYTKTVTLRASMGTDTLLKENSAARHFYSYWAYSPSQVEGIQNLYLCTQKLQFHLLCQSTKLLITYFHSTYLPIYLSGFVLW